MAYLQQNPEDEKDKGSSAVLNPAGQPASNQQQPIQVSGGQGATIESTQPGGAPASTSTISSQPSAAPKKAGSGQFTNLRQYLQANKGAGEKLGQAVTSGLSRESEKIGSAVEQQKAQQSNLIKQLETQRQQTQQQVLNAAQQAASLKAGQTLNPEQLQTTSQFLTTNQYQLSPLEQFNAAQQEAQAQELGQRAEQLGRFQGRMGELSRRFTQGGRQYTTGQGRLDSLLLGSDKAAELQQQGKQIAQELGGNISQAEQQARQQYSGLLQGTEAAQKAVQSRLASLLGSQAKSIEAATQQARQARQEEYSALKQAQTELSRKKQESIAGLDKKVLKDFGSDAYDALFDRKTPDYYGFGTLVRDQVAADMQKKGVKFKDRQDMFNQTDKYIKQQLNSPEKMGKYLMDKNMKIAAGGFGGTGDAGIVRQALNKSLARHLSPEQMEALGISSKSSWGDLLPKAELGHVVGLKDYLNAITGFTQKQLSASEKALQKKLRQDSVYKKEDFNKYGGLFGDISTATAATGEQRARYEALANLLGTRAEDRLIQGLDVQGQKNTQQTRALQQARSAVQKYLDKINVQKGKGKARKIVY